MFNKTMIWTTFIAALFTTGALKFLHFFNFIQWSPVGWGKKWLFFGSSEEGWKWVLLFIVLLIAIRFILCIIKCDYKYSASSYRHFDKHYRGCCHRMDHPYS